MTKRDKDVLDYLVAYRAAHDISPTLREIGEGVGLKSPASVQRHIEALKREGYLKSDENKKRALVPVLQSE